MGSGLTPAVTVVPEKRKHMEDLPAVTKGWLGMPMIHSLFMGLNGLNPTVSTVTPGGQKPSCRYRCTVASVSWSPELSPPDRRCRVICRVKNTDLDPPGPGCLGWTTPHYRYIGFQTGHPDRSWDVFVAVFCPVPGPLGMDRAELSELT